MCNQAEVVQNVTARLLENLCSGLVEKVVEVLTKQLSDACKIEVVEGEQSQIDPVELSLPECCKNMFQMAGRQFQRGVDHVNSQKVVN